MPQPHAYHLPAFDFSAAAAEAASRGDDRPTWAYDWPAGQRLAAELGALVPLAGKRVVDLGCGRGQLGLTALAGGADEVLFADASAGVLAFIEMVIVHNQMGDGVWTTVHRWGEPLPPPRRGGTWDLVCGGDILYRPDCFGDLAATLGQTLRPGGCALLSDPRETIEPAWFAALEANGLTVSSERRETPAPYTLCRVVGP